MEIGFDLFVVVFLSACATNSPRYSSFASLSWYVDVPLPWRSLFCVELSPLSYLCIFGFQLLVLLSPSQENSQNAPLVHATLETLLRFLNWIPLGYIFETKLISTLVYKVGPYEMCLFLI